MEFDLRMVDGERWTVVSDQTPGLKAGIILSCWLRGLKAPAPSVVSIARSARNLKVDAGGGIGVLSRGQVDLIERNLFVVLGVKIGEDS